MHRCLLIQEMLRIICMYVGTYPRRHGDLLAMALVCRHLFDASMDRLWHKVPNLFPVLGCLPSDVWVAPLSYDGISEAALARAITPADLERFQIYAHRVRVFKDSFHSIEVPANVHQALSFALQGQPVFPNLVKLMQGDDGISMQLPYIDMLLGPRIHTLKIAQDSPAQTFLLPMLGKKCPALLQFCLFAEYNPDIGYQMNHILPGWTQIQSLTVPHLPEESLRVVATLPHLVSLALTRVDSRFGDTFSHRSDNPVFPALRELNIAARTLMLSISLLRAATNSPLEKFTFHRVSVPSRLDWHLLFSALAGCTKATLTTIHINDSVGSRRRPSLGTTDQLRPLLSLTNLTHVHLFVNYEFNIDDAFVREMATAWPHLQHLDIDVFKRRQLFGQRRPTLHGLAPLAEFCPDLHALTVHVDATHVDPHPIDLSSIPSNSSVHCIVFAGSPISQSSVPLAAAYLSMVFPGLWSIDWLTMDNNDDDEEWRAYSERWGEVADHLSAHRQMLSPDLPCDICD